MTTKISSSDKLALVRLASQMPVGSPERRAILAGFQVEATAPTDFWEDPYLSIDDMSRYIPDPESKSFLMKALGAAPIRARYGSVEKLRRNLAKIGYKKVQSWGNSPIMSYDVYKSADGGVIVHAVPASGLSVAFGR